MTTKSYIKKISKNVKFLLILSILLVFSISQNSSTAFIPAPGEKIIRYEWVTTKTEILDANYEVNVGFTFTQFVIKPEIPGKITATRDVKTSISQEIQWKAKTSAGPEIPLSVILEVIGLSTTEDISSSGSGSTGGSVSINLQFSYTYEKTVINYSAKGTKIEVLDTDNILGAFSGVGTFLIGTLYAFHKELHKIIYYTDPYTGEYIRTDVGLATDQSVYYSLMILYRVNDIRTVSFYGAIIDNYDFALEIYNEIVEDHKHICHSEEAVIGYATNYIEMKSGTTTMKKTTMGTSLDINIGNSKGGSFGIKFSIEGEMTYTYSVNTKVTDVTRFEVDKDRFNQDYHVYINSLFCNGLWIELCDDGYFTSPLPDNPQFPV